MRTSCHFILDNAHRKIAVRQDGSNIVIAAALSPAGPLYKYVDIAGLKRILAGSIRFTQPSAFNDPFELLPEIVVPNDATARQLNFSFDLRAQRRHPPPGALD
jgi:hypothetical protein